MHKSKLAGFIIDCRTDDLPGAADFWSGALGMPVRELPGNEGSLYRALHDARQGLNIEVQKVDHPSRVHLDIETDDIEAEVRRLEQLGANRVGLIQTWWVMEAPTGQRFCVVRACSARFDELASEWP
ncbi:MAG TPA: VOC family protein [Steroidobacteraceae bacterium]|nr:VOC family protein [Steroidobacteraceae bacterium]